MDRHYKQSVLPIFYKIQLCILKLIGIWQLHENASKRLHFIYKIYFLCCFSFIMLLCDTLLCIQVVINLGDLNEVIKVVFVLGTVLSVLVKFCNIKLKSAQYKQLIAQLHATKFKPRCLAEAELMQQTAELSLTMRNSYTLLSLCSLNTMVLSQFNLHTKQLPLPAYNPLAINSAWKYMLMFSYMYFCISIGCFVNIAFDSLAASLLIFVRGQLNVLGYRMRNLGKNERKVNNKIIEQQLKNCINFYAEIQQLTTDIENLISFPISVQIFCTVTVLVANFYTLAFLVAPNDYYYILKFVIYQFCMMTQIFILCYFSSEITFGSEQMLKCLYESNWFDWNKQNRKLVLLMMLQFQKPIRIKAINRCYSINLETFSSIVHSSYSYFALLRRMKT